MPTSVTAYYQAKTQPSGLSNAWSRELDLNVIRGAGSAVVQMLIEQHEIDALKVTRIGEESAFGTWMGYTCRSAMCRCPMGLPCYDGKASARVPCAAICSTLSIS